MRSLRIAFGLVALAVRISDGGSLVGPGAVGSYQGGGGGRRYGGYVRVQDPPVGIFVAGSSLKEMNGIYGRVTQTPSTLKHGFHLAYQHDYTGWYIALVAASAEVKASTGRSTEWMLIDNDGEDRFRSEGDSLIPGSGTAWSHVHRTANAESDPNAGTAVGAPTEDDEEELPWQVIGVGATDMLQNLRHHFRYYKHTVQQALSGSNLPRLPAHGSQQEEPPDDVRPPVVLEDGQQTELCDFDESTSLKDALAQAESSKDEWGQAVVHLSIGTCHRCRREFEQSESSLTAALDLFPRYKSAILESALLRMDEGQYESAKQRFELLLHLDRSFPDIDTWLVRAHTHRERELKTAEDRRKAAGESITPTSYCVAWRQTGGCDPAGPREENADRPCVATVDPGLSGFCECRTSGMSTVQAAESTCEHEKFSCEDICKRRWQEYELGAPESVVPTVHACDDRDPPVWCSANHYWVLGVRCDIPDAVDGKENSELKRAFKRRGMQFHPDKHSGSAESHEAFARVSTAHEVLADAKKRWAYDMGDEIPRQAQHDGTEGPSFKDRILKKYFPDRYGCEPFGDPHADRKERAARERRRVERRRQEALARGEKVEL